METDWPPPKFTIETEPVLKLFTGENFYSSSDAALREAVLNAIDAVGRRQIETPDLEQNIKIEFQDSNLTIFIHDNGDGMDVDNITNLFSKVGATASKIAHSGGDNHKAVGEFGIGALSYFLVCDSYEIHTQKKDSPNIGLEFDSKMLDGITQAKKINPQRDNVGTTLILRSKSREIFDLLKKRLDHWIRNVKGLSAVVLPGNQTLPQGGLTREVKNIRVLDLPDWIEDANLGPPIDLSVWDKYDGKGHIDVLYRGVFVERLEIEQLWGTEGAIHVDPKHFRPKLNREGFVGDLLRSDVTPFLQSLHPSILSEAVNCVKELLDEKSEWTLSRAITLWLAVPRNAKYQLSFEIWDKVFKEIKAFRILERKSEKDASIADIINLQAEEIWLLPDNRDKSNSVVNQAILLLRASDKLVVQGIKRDSGYLSTAKLVSDSTSWVLLHLFKTELPKITDIQSVAETLVSKESIGDVYLDTPKVSLYKLGQNSAPIVVIKREVWINIENEAGRKIVQEICKRNEGHIGLWVACMMHAPDAKGLEQVSSLLRKLNPAHQPLGLVRRQYLMELIK